MCKKDAFGLEHLQQTSEILWEYTGQTWGGIISSMLDFISFFFFLED